ncbi:MAG: acetylesterase [Clostridia bacterium]|nr:acetylesterase [Clostridia bacterium]
MALIQATIYAHTLYRTVPIRVILPADKRRPDGTFMSGGPYKTLYLLHGLLGSSNDWINGTRILRWAEAKGLAVVMPSGDNSWYIDHAGTRNRYGEFIGRELVEVTRRMFPLSHRREDTFIGGLSMGGYGALLAGLKYHETFSRIIPYSAAVAMFERGPRSEATSDGYMESLFGDLSAAARTENNPRVLIAKLAALKKERPETALPTIRLSCGKDDGLVGVNRVYRDLLTENGFDVTYEETPGGHDWDFWDEQIRRTIDWLPLEEKAEGLSSGNVDTGKADAE